VMRLGAVLLAALALATSGCANSSEGEVQKPESERDQVERETEPSPVVKEEVSPACRESRETVRLESANPKSNPTYLREDEEVMQEECDAASRARWARIQHEQTPQGEAERAEEVEENAGRVQEELEEAEEVIKRRQAEHIANALEGH
jgi:hypothetical protein